MQNQSLFFAKKGYKQKNYINDDNNMSCTDQKSVHESQHDISANDSWCNFFHYLRYKIL